MKTIMTKKEILNHWQGLPDNLPLKAFPIAYKHKGSTYGADGIRIEGRTEFIEAVLSRLKPLMLGENGETRLGLSLAQIDDNKYTYIDNHVCYVKTHERGSQAVMVNSFLKI